MAKPRKTVGLLGFQAIIHKLFFLAAVFSGLLAANVQAALQFDVFLGYDGIVPEASWFPIVCEVKNDGPTFTGTIEVSAGRFNEGQTRHAVVELPTGTLKRIVIPVFSTARYQSSWDVRLLDEGGRMRSEQPGLRPKKEIGVGTLLIGALPRTATGVPTLRPVKAQDTELQPVTARFQTALIPDDPLVLEGMQVIYLNSERALELNAQQVFALMGWLNAGGHLIVGIEQVSDVNANPWLRRIVPCDITEMRTVQAHPELQKWLRESGTEDRTFTRDKNGALNPYRDLTDDPVFEKAEMQVVTGTAHGTVLASASGVPLVITSHQGRGRVTALMFSPERKPFSAWNNLPSFWSKLSGVRPELYGNDASVINANHGGWSIDGVFGAMIDSKQIRKLPVEWLLLLLLVYLVVIGPLDQYWLKRIKRPMLTWITFPCYVVLFSLLIYFIGYKLRAGETEWNELHVVDVLANGERAELRGRSYASVYSPVNATYRVETQQHFSTFRGEFQSSWSGGGQGNERAEILQAGDNFKADIFVPVWTSQLYVTDWWQASEQPIKLSVTASGNDWSVEVKNERDHPLSRVRLVIADRIMEIGDLPANQTKTFKFQKEHGTLLRDFVAGLAGSFQNASQARQRAFGSSGGGQIVDIPNSTMAVSFISNLAQERFISPAGLDMSPLLGLGNAVLLAWEPDYSPIKPINQFATRRGRKDTLWRVSVPIDAP